MGGRNILQGLDFHKITITYYKPKQINHRGMLIPAAGTCITTFTSIGTKKGVSVSLAEGKYQYWQYPYQRPKEAKKRHN